MLDDIEEVDFIYIKFIETKALKKSRGFTGLFKTVVGFKIKPSIANYENVFSTESLTEDPNGAFASFCIRAGLENRDSYDIALRAEVEPAEEVPTHGGRWPRELITFAETGLDLVFDLTADFQVSSFRTQG